MTNPAAAILARELTNRLATSALPDAPVVPDRTPSALRRWSAGRLTGLAIRLDHRAVQARLAGRPALHRITAT